MILGKLKFSLRLKLILLSTILVTVIMASVTFFFTIREIESRRVDVENQVERIARNIATMQLVDRLDWSIYQNYITKLITVDEDIIYIAIYDDRLDLRAHSLNLNLVEVDNNGTISRRRQEEIVQRLDEGAVAIESQDDMRTQTVNIQSGDHVLGSVHVGFSLIEINNHLRDDIIRNVSMALFFLVIFGTLSVIFSRRLSKPLEHLSAAMDGVKAGDLDHKVKIVNRDEIGKLAANFNDMVDGLRERRIIEKLGQELGATFQLDRLALLIRERLKGVIGAKGAILFLRDRQNKNLFYEINPEQNSDEPRALKLDDPVQTIFLENSDGFFLKMAPEIVQNAFSNPFRDNNDLVIPMNIKGELFGLLVFEGQTEENQVDRKRQHSASILANQAALALENSLLYDDLRDQERLKHELEIARDVQKKLLPSEMPVLPGFEVDSTCIPANEVGGDYYDLFRMDEDRMGIVIADVSGKGASAAFYMAEIKGMMMSLVPIHRSPKSLLVDLNHKLYQTFERNIFTSMIYGILDFKKNQFNFARAGHNSLLHIRADGFCDLITPPGIGLGLDSGRLFEQQLKEVELILNPGDSFLLFTDGLTDAMNSKMEAYGEERLIETICKKQHLDASHICSYILRSVQDHVNGHDQHDDLTMVLVKCLAESNN